MPTYEIKVFYSDEGCIAIAPDLPGCSAFGETEDEARKEMMTAMELWLKTAMEQGLVRSFHAVKSATYPWPIHNDDHTNQGNKPSN